MPEATTGTRWVGPLTLVTLVLASTGLAGLAVPGILGLRATEFVFYRLLLAALFVLPALAVAPLVGRRRPIALAIALALPTSVAVNLALGQDPLFAWSNWRVGATDFLALPTCCSDVGSIGIANHEHVLYDPTLRLHYVLGPGLPVPAPLRASVGRDLW